MSPQEQAAWLSKQADDAKARRYWERNATVAFTILTVSALASTLIAPISWAAAVGSVGAGALFYVGVRKERQGKSGVGNLLMLCAFGVVATLALISGLSKALFVVQVLGLLVAGFTGSEVFRQAIGKGSE